MRRLDVDVLVTGQTHQAPAVVPCVDGANGCVVNPGSITGAYTPTLTAPQTTSFMLMKVPAPVAGQAAVTLEFFIYELVNGDVKVSRSVFSANRRS
jgi:hypothetical protein